MLKQSIEEYGIYKNKELRKFIYELEDTYEVNNEVDFFNSLVNFSKNKDIPYHSWFNYREGYSHKLVSELIERSEILDDEYVLDPFCGSGTTVVESAIQGIASVGIDINPLSAFISEVKCQSYSEAEINKIRNRIDLIDQIDLKEIDTNYDKKYNYVSRFFSKDNYNDFISLRQLIDSLESNEEQKINNFFKCAYLCIVQDVSDRKRDGNGLKTLVSTVENVKNYYVSKTLSMLNDILLFPINENVDTMIDLGDAKALTLTVDKVNVQFNKKIGSIIFSPPYANSFDYFENYKMELILADYASDMKSVGNLRKSAIESYIGAKTKRENPREFVKWISEEIESSIPDKENRTGKKDNRTRKVPKMLLGYFEDMEEVIEECSLVLEKGKKLYIVVDQSAYLGKIVPTDLYLAKIAEYYDFHVDEIIICRNAKTSGQQSKLYPYLNRCLRESIVVLQKT